MLTAKHVNLYLCRAQSGSLPIALVQTYQTKTASVQNQNFFNRLAYFRAKFDYRINVPFYKLIKTNILDTDDTKMFKKRKIKIKYLDAIISGIITQFLLLLVLMLNVHVKHLWSCRDGQLPYPHLTWAGLDLLSGKHY